MQATPVLIPEEIALINAINAFRVQNNRQPLQVSVALTNAAKFLANDMATNNFLSHIDSLGRNPFQRMDAFGYAYQTQRGENVAAGSPSGVVTFEQWRDACDPNAAGQCTFAHREIMLDPAYQVLGVGRAFNPNSTFGYYWAADFGGFTDALIPLTGGSIITTPQMGPQSVGPSPVEQNAGGMAIPQNTVPTAPVNLVQQPIITPVPIVVQQPVIAPAPNPIVVPAAPVSQGLRFGNVVLRRTTQAGIFRF